MLDRTLASPALKEHSDRWRVFNSASESPSGCCLEGDEGKAEAACTLDEALQTLRVNLAELRSLETQQWETP